MRQKPATVHTISASRTRTSAEASAPRCQAKNSHDQSALAASCRPNRANAPFVEPGDRHTSHAETPISEYNTDQTGPNNHPGGAHGGLLNCA